MSRASLQRRLFLGALAWIVLALVATGVLLSVLFREHLEDELARRLDQLPHVTVNTVHRDLGRE